MIDGRDIADKVISARVASVGISLDADETAALSAYLVHLITYAAERNRLREEYNKLQRNHAPYVMGNIEDYIVNAEEALQGLRQYATEAAKHNAKSS